MKRLEEFITEEEINEGLFDWLKKLFQSGGRAAASSVANVFKEKFPKWYEEYKKIDAETDPKKIQALLDGIDDNDDIPEKNKNAKKLAILNDVLSRTKSDEIKDFCNKKIKEIKKEDPDSMKEYEADLKAAAKEKDKGEGEDKKGDGEEEPQNPAKELVEDPESKGDITTIAKSLNAADFFKNIVTRLEKMFDESKKSLHNYVMVVEGKKSKAFMKALYSDKDSHMDANLVLTTLLLAYQKIITIAQDHKAQVNQKTIGIFLNALDNANSEPKEVIKDTKSKKKKDDDKTSEDNKKPATGDDKKEDTKPAASDDATQNESLFEAANPIELAATQSETKAKATAIAKTLDCVTLVKSVEKRMGNLWKDKNAPEEVAVLRALCKNKDTWAEASIALTTIALAYEKIKMLAQEHQGKNIKSDIIKQFLDDFNNAK
jgi:hypothetical protein